MEYFVDEMPRDCASCKHYHMNCADGYSCSKLRKEIHPNFSEGIGYRHQDCPLQSLSDHDNQVRKEVCERLDKTIKKYLCKKGKYRESLDISSIIKQVMKENLDQIQGK